MEVAEWFINNPFLVLACFAAVAMASNDDKFDYIVKALDKLNMTITEYGVRIKSLEEYRIRQEEKQKYEEEVEENKKQKTELEIYRFILKNVFKIVGAIITALLIALAMGWLKL